MSELAISEPLLAFTAVGSDLSLESIDLVVRPGECCVVESSPDVADMMADLAQGLEAPDTGTVTALGKNWQELAPDKAYRVRSRMGRVFRSPAWVHNLNVDENVMLPQLDLSTRPEADIRQEVEGLARRLGLDGLPRTRPHATDPAELSASACVRAFAGAPDLVLIETRSCVLPTQAHSGLISLVHDTCARGGAVVWFSDSHGAHSVLPLGPRVRMSRGSLVVSRATSGSDTDKA